MSRNLKNVRGQDLGDIWSESVPGRENQYKGLRQKMLFQEESGEGSWKELGVGQNIE